MSLKTRNKRNALFNMSSLTDIIFLLLIFFLLTSTLVQPNAVKLLLPNSSSKTQARQTVAVAIDANLNYYVNNKKVAFGAIGGAIRQQTAADADPTVVLYADKSVPVDNVIKLMSVANDLQIKMILATQPQK